MTAPKILLVEDDVNLGFVIKDNLEMNGGFQVRLCEDGEEGWQAFLQKPTPNRIFCEIRGIKAKLLGAALPKPDEIDK